MARTARTATATAPAPAPASVILDSPLRPQVWRNRGWETNQPVGERYHLISRNCSHEPRCPVCVCVCADE